MGSSGQAREEEEAASVYSYGYTGTRGANSQGGDEWPGQGGECGERVRVHRVHYTRKQTVREGTSGKAREEVATCVYGYTGTLVLWYTGTL
jgi:hypothetical protein